MASLKKAVQFSRTGKPSDVVEIIELETPEIRSGTVLIDIEAAAINPSHLLTLSGGYGVQPDLPAIPGAEGIGKIIEIGDGVTNVSVGDRVMIPPYSGTWRQQVLVEADKIEVTFPSEGNPMQMAMIMANPPTAWLLLKTVVNLEPGDWLIQNAANSAVGQYIMQLSHIYNYKTVNVVRREGFDNLITQSKGDICVIDGPDLGERVKEKTNGAKIKLAIDAVAGDSTQYLADSIADNARIANYGLLSGEPCKLSPEDIIFRNISLTGVWLTMWLRGRNSTKGQRASVYNELRNYIIEGKMHAQIEATYTLENIKDAVEHAMRQRNGKIIILPNG